MRLIDADAFSETLQEVSKKQGYDNLQLGKFLYVSDVFDAVIASLNGEALNGFQDSPTVDAVPIVRCEHCRYYKGGMLGGSCGCCTHPDWKIQGHCHQVEKDGFCYRGKRRCEEMIEYGG